MRSIIREHGDRASDERLAAFRDKLTGTLARLDPQSRVTILDVAREMTDVMEAGVKRGDLEAVVGDALRTVEEQEFRTEFEIHKLEATTGG